MLCWDIHGIDWLHFIEPIQSGRQLYENFQYAIASSHYFTHETSVNAELRKSACAIVLYIGKRLQIVVLIRDSLDLY
jgi:hypothetical protein